MITVEAANVDSIWRQLVRQARETGRQQAGRDQPTRELLHVACTLADPRQRLVFARPMNPAFAVAEVIWILAGANDVGFLRFWNPRMARFADDEQRFFHGAYGYRLGSDPRLRRGVAKGIRHRVRGGGRRIDQLRDAYETLRRDPTSRQVVLQIWDRARDLPNPTPRSRDVPCNLVSHLLVREGRLEWLQVMRSNDLIWGLPYNFVQWTTMQEVMAGWLGLDLGTYNHVSDSLHVYERHWEELARVEAQATSVPMNRADLRIESYEEWERLWTRVVDAALALTHPVSAEQLVAVIDQYADLPPAYVEWVALLTAEALRRCGHETTANEVIPHAGGFWEASWRQWAASARNATARRLAAGEARPLDRSRNEATYRNPNRLLQEYRDASPARRAEIIENLGALLNGEMGGGQAPLATVDLLGELTSIVEMEESVELQALAQQAIDQALPASIVNQADDHLSGGRH